jgi:hypothetical protein
MASVDFKTFLTAAPYILEARYPIILRGRHGIGKSEIVYQIERELSYTNGVIERRASQMTEGDLMGLPSVSERKGTTSVTKWNPPDWFKEACDSGVLLFLDEIDRATPEVRQGIFELTDSRKLNGHTLHEDTVIVAAVNGGENSSEYQVGEMDPAELDRYTVFDVEPTIEDWLEWSKDVVTPVVWDFINQSRNHLEHSDGNFEPGKVYPSRRSWARFSETLCAAGDPRKADASLLFTLAQGFVGFEAAISFRDFVTNYEKLVTVEDILTEGNIAATSDFSINQHGALIEKMDASNIFESTLLSKEQLGNLAMYFVSLPGEMAMKLFGIVGKSQLKENILNFHGTEIGGKRIGDHVVSLVSSIPEENK